MTYSYANLVPQHRPDLVAFAIRLCRSREQAEDVVQAALTRALEAWESFRGNDHGPDLERTVRAWLFMIVRHCHASLWRRTQFRQAANVARREVVVEATYGSLEDVSDPWSKHPDAEYSDEVTDALMGLDDGQRAVIDLATEGRSYREIAVELQISIGTVMSRLHRARRRLEAQLGDYARREYGMGLPRNSTRADAPADEPANCEQPETDAVDAVV